MTTSHLLLSLVERLLFFPYTPLFPLLFLATTRNAEEMEEF